MHRKTCEEYAADRECGESMMRGRCCGSCHACSQDCLLIAQITEEPATTSPALSTTPGCSDDPPPGAPVGRISVHDDLLDVRPRSL